MTTLFRPVGLLELALIWDAEMGAFPRRLPHQPIFYPVTTNDYAEEIASRWNVTDEASGFAGYVTRFEVRDEFIANFKPHTVGSHAHNEYWIPAEGLPEFNRAIEGKITVTRAFFGEAFRGWIPDHYCLKGRTALEQIVFFHQSLEDAPMDFSIEVSANRKAVYLNSPYWSAHDFSAEGIDDARKKLLFCGFKQAWEHRTIETPLPF